MVPHAHTAALPSTAATHPPLGGRQWLQGHISAARASVIDHPIYDLVTTRERLTRFMGLHVFAVWDFMSLLKALQRQVTCVDTPWVPTGQARARRLINSIVLDEESDLIDGRVFSHFELYLAAMREVGADTTRIERFVKLVGGGHDVATALSAAGVPAGAQTFVLQTMAFVREGKPHALAAAFTVGREDAIPEMFRRLLASIPDAPTMAAYLERHIALDGDHHADQGFALIDDLCGDDPTKWREAGDAAVAALRARADLWSATVRSL